MASKQNTQAINEWRKENNDVIRIEVRKSEYMPVRIQQALDKGLARSRSAYILQAVLEKLERDGVPMLGSISK